MKIRYCGLSIYNLYYFCDECNKKYRREKKFVLHKMRVHHCDATMIDLQRRRTRREQKDKCIVCFSTNGPFRSAYVPCGHKQMCDKCAIEIKKEYGRCPTCRSTIKSIIKIYD